MSARVYNLVMVITKSRAFTSNEITKLREIFEGFKEHWINRWLFLNHEQCLEELMLAIKKVLDVEGIGKL